MANRDCREFPAFTAHNIERFTPKVDKSGGPDACWLWTGNKGHNGYGLFSLHPEKITVRAHRMAYLLEYGVDPGILFVCHTCDQRLCCNPKHLWCGTAADNTHDGMAKGRMRFSGEKNGRAKLTEQDIIEMRALYDSGSVSQDALGKRYGMGSANIHRIVHRKLWKGVA